MAANDSVIRAAGLPACVINPYVIGTCTGLGFAASVAIFGLELLPTVAMAAVVAGWAAAWSP